MELKLIFSNLLIHALALLIVPYGIETCVKISKQYSLISFNRTIWNWNNLSSLFLSKKTAFNRTIWNWNSLTTWKTFRRASLLIVPYGIETEDLLLRPVGQSPFNRTIWNWNYIIRNPSFDYSAFNRTIWNWNRSPAMSRTWSRTFNRTIWNWNYTAAPCANTPDNF